jgi:hypothetical protein
VWRSAIISFLSFAGPYDQLMPMQPRKLTFDEAVKAMDFTIMTKQRLLVVQRDLFEQLDRVGLF